jgi:hypothetical protein
MLEITIYKFTVANILFVLLLGFFPLGTEERKKQAVGTIARSNLISQIDYFGRVFVTFVNPSRTFS